MPQEDGLNGQLSYTDETGDYSHSMWVMEVDQPHTLTGQTYQSRTRRHFYPRYFAPGNIAITGRCVSQTNYQRLAWFIRRHQRTILNTPNDQRFARIDESGKGFQRLMRLSIPSEHLLVRGFIPNFTITKKGVHDVAPQFTFEFLVIFDQTASNIEISTRLKKFYSASDYAVATAQDKLEAEQRQAFTDANTQDIIDQYHHPD